MRNPETSDWDSYIEFNELDGRGYFPLLDEDEKIASNSIADVLNYFSALGWEMIHIEYPTDLSDYESVGEYEVLFKRRIKDAL